ncbi:MAG: type II secretion system protein [Opitutales bacterium]|nr:type II secretion system protein [Opitutales bacterium]
MEVKKTHKIGGFLSIELMLVLSVVAIFGGISLYVGKRVIDRAKMVAMEAEAQMFIMKLLEYYDMMGEWSIATDNFVSVWAVALELNKAFDKVLDNPYSLSRKNPEEFPNIWVRIGTRKKLNQRNEDALTEFRRRTQRDVSENEIKYFDRVRYFVPKKDDRPWIKSAEEDINNRHPGIHAVLG